MTKTAEQLRAELAALEAKPTGTPVFAPAPMKRRFTEAENSHLTWMRETLAELKQESEAYVREGQQQTVPEPAPEPVKEPQPKSTMSTDDYFAYQSWRIEREASGQPSEMSDWIAPLNP